MRDEKIDNWYGWTWILYDQKNDQSMPRKINWKEDLLRGKVIVVKHGSHATNCDIISIINLLSR